MKIIYRYDALDRLVEAVWDDGHRVTYAYDAAGNRLSVNRPDLVQPLEVAPAPAPESLELKSPQKPSATFTEVMPPARVAAPSPADATRIESRQVSFEIIVLSGALENQHFPVGDQLHLGREADNDLILPDKKVSRHHAILQRQGIVYQVTDLNSGNGTFVNGKRIADATLLKNGDIIIIGDTKLTIHDRP